MYLMNSDMYVCDICGFEGGWDDHDDIHGSCGVANGAVVHFVQNVLLIK